MAMYMIMVYEAMHNQVTIFMLVLFYKMFLLMMFFSGAINLNFDILYGDDFRISYKLSLDERKNRILIVCKFPAERCFAGCGYFNV